MEKVDPSTPSFWDNYRSGKNLSILVGNLLVILQMASIAAAVHFLGSRAAPGWNGIYLIWMAIFLSIEAIYTRQKVKELESRERIIFRISEWIAFAVMIKIVLYLIRGPQKIFEDLALWQEDFIQYFFTGEYMVSLLVAILVWWSSAASSTGLEQLYERELDTSWDDLGKLQNALHAARSRIAARMFILGTFVVGLAVLSRVEVASDLLRDRVLGARSILPVVNVVLYFVIALILLTHTQYALLRTRWLTQNLSVSSNLARNWIRYGLAFFAFVGLVVLFLPTDYSLGLLDTLRYTLGFLFKALGFLLALVTLPITFCLSLFSFASLSETSPGGGDISRIPVAPPNEPLAWWEFVRSLLFWLFFIGIILFAFRYYLMQNKALYDALRKIPILKWISEFWHGLWGWLKGANRQVTLILKQGIQRLRSQPIRLPGSPFRRPVNPASLSPRERVIYFYLNLVQAGEEKGISRKPSQTPYSYQQSITSVIPDVDPDMIVLTENFLEARYSQHAIDESNAALTGSLWERIKAALRGWQKPERPR